MLKESCGIELADLLSINYLQLCMKTLSDITYKYEGKELAAINLKEEHFA